ncbi:hypothetical protein C8R45DRAFT_923748 [Mycena sanguinolenta]|nr:hypothetical protein C8R45DRAFT_923748 [Mycena sanguinolenta]
MDYLPLMEPPLRTGCLAPMFTVPSPMEDPQPYGAGDDAALNIYAAKPKLLSPTTASTPAWTSPAHTAVTPIQHVKCDPTLTAPPLTAAPPSRPTRAFLYSNPASVSAQSVIARTVHPRENARPRTCSSLELTVTHNPQSSHPLGTYESMNSGLWKGTRMELRRYGLWRHLALHFEELLTRCTSCPINSRKEDSHWCKSSKVGTGRNMRKHWARRPKRRGELDSREVRGAVRHVCLRMLPASAGRDAQGRGDPSSLSKSATAAGAKRPSNLKKSTSSLPLGAWNYFSKLVYWTAGDNIIQHFEQCGTRLPDTESLWVSARMLVRHYASQEAYPHALNQKLAECASNTMRVPRGTHWVAPANNSSSNRGDDENMDVDPEEETEGVVVDESEEFRGLKEFFVDFENASGSR